MQTGSYRIRRSLSRVDPDRSQTCPKRGHNSGLSDDMLWLCAALSSSSSITEEQWEASLKSNCLHTQLHSVQRVHDIAAGLHLPVPSCEEPPT
ncbi:hypothetical protein HPB50_010659 [Hyalomma asiaticum]|uniref:Uncharacterized protein n=1 Tax=Hyalomma asiaticum TaxID=266040 RepID=A0ACB7TM42_HYAAI|nr:hypothetical protein HPB50_010659 [Hyalomma asiaticum]